MANVTLSALARLLDPSSNIDPTAAAMAQLSAQLGNQPREPMAETYGGWVQANPGVMGNAMGDVGSAISGALSQFASMRQRDRMKAERQNITSKDQIDPRDLVNAEDPELRAIGGKMLASKALTQQEKKDLQDQNLGVPFKVVGPDGKLRYYNAQRHGAPKDTGLEAPVELMAQNLGDRYDIRPRVGGVEGYRDERLIAPTPKAPEYNAETGQVIDPNELYKNSPSGQNVQQERQRIPVPVPPQGGGFGTLPNGVPRQMPERNILLPNGKVDPEAAREEWGKLFNHESGGRQSAVSPQGAIGVGQIMPKTAEGLGIDPHDPQQNVQGSAKLWMQALEQAGGDVEMARRIYHGGPNKKIWGPKNDAYVTKVENTPSYFGDAMPNPGKTQVQPPPAPAEVPTPDSPLGQQNNIPGVTKVAPSKEERTAARAAEDDLGKIKEYRQNLDTLEKLVKTINWDADVPAIGKGNLARMAKDLAERNLGYGQADERNKFMQLAEAVMAPKLKEATGGGQIAIPEQLMARLGLGLQPKLGGPNMLETILRKRQAADEWEALIKARANVAPTGPHPAPLTPAFDAVDPATLYEDNLRFLNGR